MVLLLQKMTCLQQCVQYTGPWESTPQNHSSGGYELMRTQDKGSKLLNVIDVPPSGYSATYLKAVAHSARIFIRPLQRDLSLLPEKVEVNNYF